MKRFKRLALVVLAFALLALGVVGLFLPFLQGVLFIAIGIVLLSLLSPRVRSFLEPHRIRFPKLHALLERAEEWVKRIIGEI